MNFLRNNKHRGTFKAYAAYKDGKECVGAYAYYLSEKHIVEVMLIAARRDSRDKVLQLLLYEAGKEKVLCIWGRNEPKYLHCLWDNNCLLKRGSWVLFHTNKPELANVIHRGDAFLSSLEGELWLRSPSDRL
jgi:hypothetical protein